MIRQLRRLRRTVRRRVTQRHALRIVDAAAEVINRATSTTDGYTVPPGPFIELWRALDKFNARDLD